jgi:amino acid transporter
LADVKADPQPGLRRVLTLRTVVSNSAGITFATSSFVAAAQVAGYALGDGSWIAVLVAGLLVLLVAGSFAELNGMFPSAAAIRVYLQRGYQDRFALSVSFLYVFVVVVVLGAEAYVLSQALSALIPAVPPLVWVAALLVLTALLNLRGVAVAGRFQDVVTYAVVASIFVISFIAFAHAGRPWRPLGAGGFSGVVQAVAVGVFLFVGFEWVTPLAEEVAGERLIARGMYVAVALLTVAYAVLTVAMGHVLGRAELASPIPQILFAGRVAGAFGAWWLLAVSLGASATTFNAGFTAASRFLYATGREGVLPRWFARLDLRTLVPRNAIWALLALAVASTAAVYATRSFHALVDLGAATESAVYALVSIAVLRIRRRDPERRRPYVAPGVPWLQAFTAVVFALLTLAAALDGGPAVAALLALGWAAAYAYAALGVPRVKAAAARRRG